MFYVLEALSLLIFFASVSLSFKSWHYYLSICKWDALFLTKRQTLECLSLCCKYLTKYLTNFKYLTKRQTLKCFIFMVQIFDPEASPEMFYPYLSNSWPNIWPRGKPWNVCLYVSIFAQILDQFQIFDQEANFWNILSFKRWHQYSSSMPLF